jgi:hypothetical protein
MINRNLLRSAGLAAGLLGLVALAPSAYAQNAPQTFWNGAGEAPGPTGASTPMMAPGYGAPSGPGYGWGPGYNGGPTAGGHPYWNGAGEAIGPAS